MVLDKTGTLTQGRPEVVDVVWLQPEEQYAAPLVVAEEQSQHPLAKAIATHWESHIESRPVIDRYENVSGKGIEFEIQGETLRIGNRAFVTASSLNPIPKQKLPHGKAKEKALSSTATTRVSLPLSPLPTR